MGKFQKARPWRPLEKEGSGACWGDRGQVKGKEEAQEQWGARQPCWYPPVPHLQLHPRNWATLLFALINCPHIAGSLLVESRGVCQGGRNSGWDPSFLRPQLYLAGLQPPQSPSAHGSVAMGSIYFFPTPSGSLLAPKEERNLDSHGPILGPGLVGAPPPCLSLQFRAAAYTCQEVWVTGVGESLLGSQCGCPRHPPHPPPPA